MQKSLGWTYFCKFFNCKRIVFFLEFENVFMDIFFVLFRTSSILTSLDGRMILYAMDFTTSQVAFENR